MTTAVAQPLITPNRPSSAAAPLAASKRNPALDGLRGLAVLATLLAHYELRAWPYRSGVFFPSWFILEHGWLGVESSFALSGFLITGILFDAKEQPHYWRNYYARRTLRIFPLYYLALAIFFFLLPHIGGAPFGAAVVPARTQLWFWTYSENVLIALRGFGASPAYTPHFWTLALEEQFYVVWPLLVFLSGRRALLRASFALSIVSLGLRLALFKSSGNYLQGWMLAPSHLDGLALGSFAAILIRGPRATESFRVPALRVLAGLAAVIFALELARGHRNADDLVIGTVGLWLWSAFFACLMIVAAASRSTDLTQRILSWRPLQGAGRICYGLYVWHYMLLVALASVGFTIAALETRFASTWRAHAVFVLVNFGGTLVLAVMSWHLFEKPILKLKRLFPYANDFAASSRLSGAGGRNAVTESPATASPVGSTPRDPLASVS